MPYRDQATVSAWVEGFLAANPDVRTEVSVLEKDFVAGPDSGLVAVSLHNASTVTYIQAAVRDGRPTWVVTFEARSDSFDLDAAGVERLAHDLLTIALICAHLQTETDAALQRLSAPSD
jgi:hypothetical protein